MSQSQETIALAISASSDICSLAVRDAAGTIGELAFPARQQSARLIAGIDELLRAADLRRGQLAELRIDRGPGSYTGLRMALTFARVFAAHAALPIRTCTSLELLAVAAWRRHGIARDRAVRPILDARRERWYTASLRLAADGVTFVSPAAALPIRTAQTTIAGDELLLAAPPVRAQLAADAPAIDLPVLAARDLFDPAVCLAPIAAEDLEPLYLMGSYTE